MKLVSFMTQDMMSKTISCLNIVFWRHVWRRKACSNGTTNHLPNSGTTSSLEVLSIIIYETSQTVQLNDVNNQTDTFPRLKLKALLDLLSHNSIYVHFICSIHNTAVASFCTKVRIYLAKCTHMFSLFSCTLIYYKECIQVSDYSRNIYNKFTI